MRSAEGIAERQAEQTAHEPLFVGDLRRIHGLVQQQGTGHAMMIPGESAFVHLEDSVGKREGVVD